MAPPRLHLVRWAMALGLAGVVSIPPTGAARAQFFDPFFQYYAPQAPAYAPQAPVYAPSVVYRRSPRFSRRSRPVLTWVPDRPHVRRSRVPERVRHVSVPRPTPARIRLASLPVSVPAPKRKLSEPPAVKERVRDEGRTKLVPREPTGDPVAALLKDPTLRRGDIVVLPDGPKVFKGGRTTPHRLSDFEDVRRTKLVGEKTRRQLTAMPVQSRPTQIKPEIAERRPANQDDAEGQQVAEQVTTTGSLPRKVGP
jgi:hypothetical protein